MASPSPASGADIDESTARESEEVLASFAAHIAPHIELSLLIDRFSNQAEPLSGQTDDNGQHEHATEATRPWLMQEQPQAGEQDPHIPVRGRPFSRSGQTNPPGMTPTFMLNNCVHSPVRQGSQDNTLNNHSLDPCAAMQRPAKRRRQEDKSQLIADKQPKPVAKRQKGARKIPGAGVVADYSSPLLTHQDTVRSWPTTFGYDFEEMGLVLQYFDQVAQLKGQSSITRILEKRTPEVLFNRKYRLLDELDPLRKFPAERKAGVPPLGFDLGKSVDPEGVRPSLPSEQAKFTKRAEMFQLVEYKKTWEPLPIGTTCAQILEKYPNHLYHEFLDAFMQHGMTAGSMWKLIPDDIKHKIEFAGITSSRTKTANFLQARLQQRRRLREELFGETAEDAFINSNIKIRNLGLPGSPIPSGYQTQSVIRSTERASNHAHVVEPQRTGFSAMLESFPSAVPSAGSTVPGGIMYTRPDGSTNGLPSLSGRSALAIQRTGFPPARHPSSFPHFRPSQPNDGSLQEHQYHQYTASAPAKQAYDGEWEPQWPSPTAPAFGGASNLTGTGFRTAPSPADAGRTYSDRAGGWSFEERELADPALQASEYPPVYRSFADVNATQLPLLSDVQLRPATQTRPAMQVSASTAAQRGVEAGPESSTQTTYSFSAPLNFAAEGLFGGPMAEDDIFLSPGFGELEHVEERGAANFTHF